MKNILLALLGFSISCQAQKSIEQYSPIKIAYESNVFPQRLEYITIMNYTLINPQLARQFYDNSKEKFLKINSQLSFSKDECKSIVETYISKITDSTFSGIFYNPYSNKKIMAKIVSKSIYKIKIDNSYLFFRCDCVPTKYLNLPKNYKSILSEFNLPGGFSIEIDEIKNDQFKNKIRYLSSKDTLANTIFLNLEYKILNKTIIYSSPNSPTKMYLLKGDEVEIIKEKDEWLKIRYYGKKTIEGWIKKSDVE